MTTGRNVGATCPRSERAVSRVLLVALVLITVAIASLVLASEAFSSSERVEVAPGAFDRLTVT